MVRGSFGRWFVVLVVAFISTATLMSAPMLDTPKYKALLDLQQYKSSMRYDYADERYKQATLLNLNTNVGRWYLLDMVNKRGRSTILNLLTVHQNITITLDPTTPLLHISENGKEAIVCSINDEIEPIWRKYRRKKSSYVSICSDRLLMVIHQDGYQRMIEKGAELLRWIGGDIGESIISSVKTTFFKDKYRVEEKPKELSSSTIGDNESMENNSTQIKRASIANRYLNTTLDTYTLGLKTQSGEKQLLAGEWYKLKNFSHAYTSIIMPGMVSKDILHSYRDRVSYLNGIERHSMVYLMALDLKKYTLDWGHGTDHPGVGWSPRARNIKRDNRYGPDGFNSLKPLVTLGHVPPYEWYRTVGTFSAGFQNRHGAFKYGPLSRYDKAHPYGFMDDGVMMTTPSKELATIIIYIDGRVEMKRWTEEDFKHISEMRFIRQNGVPLIYPSYTDIDEEEMDTVDTKSRGIPGKWVNNWGGGNWSGSVKVELRTPRGAACILPTPDADYLVYAYFSSATPSAMARVLQSYGCHFAIHLDMNSPGQAYASLFKPNSNPKKIDSQLLMTDMEGYMGGESAHAPRFLIKPDYKDFFYILRRER